MGLSVGKVGQFAGGFLSITGMSQRFLVIIDHSDYDLGSWSKVSGLKVNWTACEYRHGASTETYSVPGNPSYERIRLSRAACHDSQVVQGWLASLSSRHEPLSGAIHLCDFAGLTIVKWELKYCYPVGWSIGDLDARTTSVAVETLELAHTGFLDDDATFSLM